MHERRGCLRGDVRDSSDGSLLRFDIGISL